MAASLPSQVEKARPFLKWAGGKSQLLKQYEPFLPQRKHVGSYFEPFLGSAAVYFHLQPSRAVLADVNRKLVETYAVVQEDVEALIKALEKHENDEEAYYRVRAQKPENLSRIERAARLIYLNRTCYNGLYRENSKGEFNVPFGRYRNPTICDKGRLRKASLALQGVRFMVADFREVVAPARAGDFVYFDPPYAPLNGGRNFTSYNRFGFNADDQRRLAETCHELTASGCNVMLSNSSAELIYELYSGRGYRLIEIKARRSINSRADGRGPVSELLILNY